MTLAQTSGSLGGFDAAKEEVASGMTAIAVRAMMRTMMVILNFLGMRKIIFG